MKYMKAKLFVIVLGLCLAVGMAYAQDETTYAEEKITKKDSSYVDNIFTADDEEIEEKKCCPVTYIVIGLVIVAGIGFVVIKRKRKK